MDCERRRLLQLTAAGGAATLLPGCAVTDFLFRKKKPTVITCEDGSYPVVDTHAHFFNASDLQAGQYLMGPVLNDFIKYENYRVIELAMEYIGRVIQRVGNSLAPTAEEELAQLEKADIAVKSTLKNRSTFSYLSDDYEKVSKMFFESLTQEEIAELQQAIDQTQALEQRNLRQTSNQALANAIEPLAFDENTLFKAITGQLSPQLSALERQQKSSILAASLIFGLDDLFSFVLRMLSKRSSNLAEFQYSYSKVAGSPFVINATDITVDFDYWLDCQSKYTSSIESQIALHEKLHHLTNKFTIPLLGVNPMKLVHKGNEYKDLIKQTLSRKIYKGVKIYPTHGFSPNGELHPDFANRFKTCGFDRLPSSAEIQRALYDIYDICLASDAVVMAHSKNSKGYPKSAATLAGPEYWKRVFNNESYKDLKVNFGHIGSYSSSDDSNWNSEFLSLLKEGNRFGDVGYWFMQGYSKELTSLFSKAKNIIGSDFDRRLLYGTDWFMVTSEGNWKPYLTRTNAAFDGLISANIFDSVADGFKAKDRFFYENAAQLYGSSVRACNS